MNKTKDFQKLLHEPGSFILPGAYDAMSAKLIEEIGFKAIYATGAGISNAQLGWADVGLTSLKEVVDIVSPDGGCYQRSNRSRCGYRIWKCH